MILALKLLPTLFASNNLFELKNKKSGKSKSDKNEMCENS